MMELEKLPEHVILIVFSFLNIKDFGRVLRVCHTWARLVKDHSLWKTVDLRNNNGLTWMRRDALHIIDHWLTSYTTNLIVECSISSTFLKRLNNSCPQLKQLVLYACNLEGSSPYVGRLQFPQLKTLDWRLTNGFLAELAHLSVECEKVENLGLGQQLSAVPANQLFINQHHLKILDCHESLFITDRSLEILAQHCPHLVSVSFINCANLQGTSLPALVVGCPKLTTLRMRGQRLRGTAFQDINWRATSLTELDLHNIDRLLDGTLVIMLSSLKHLTYLRCPVTNYILTNLRSGFTELQILKLHSNYPITRECLTTFLCACPNLTVLDISTEPVNAEHFVTFLPHLPNMKYLSIAGNNDTDITVELIELFCPLLQVLCIQFYRACINSRLSMALVSLIRANRHMEKVLVSGINVERIIEETRSELDGRLGMRRVDVIEDEYFEGMEVIPPVNSLDNLMKATFHDYQVISEKRLSGSRTMTISRFLSQREVIYL